MPSFSSHKFSVAVLMSGLAIYGQAQEVDSRWQLRVTDLSRRVRVEATVRFLGKAATESCISGKWKRVVVEAQTVRDEKFFPLAERLAYELENSELTLGRTTVCDDYLFLSGKSKGPMIQGTYKGVSIGTSQKLGYFSLTKMP
ncbi:hypothetical protein [Massilia phyllosphaerae]|uniref:hypothetical protein n=1 Tax=Massilia phyllosphaerae TaxID=3106034 RepID=UPI002B1CDAD6|nr:hypothetical protein [Massilia sp. SGZ-792]